MCVDAGGGPAGQAKSETVSPDNSVRNGTTFNPELGKKFAARWAKAYESQGFASIAKEAGVSDPDSRALEGGVAMAGWTLEGRNIDDASISTHIPGVPSNIGNRDLLTATKQARQIAHYLINEAQNYSGKTDEAAEPATVKISQGDRTENSDGTVIPISVSGNSDNNKATIKVEGSSLRCEANGYEWQPR